MEEGQEKNTIPLLIEEDSSLDRFIDKMTLFHGSSVAGISEFSLDKEVDDTLGKGIYFTSEPESAQSYAQVRAKNRGGAPVIYEVQVENIRLANLTVDENVKKILDSWKGILENEATGKSAWWEKQVFSETVNKINNGQIKSGNLRDVTFSNGISFTNYLKSLGYDGLIGIEGGEGEGFKHDSYVIFDPQKARVTRETKLQ